MFEHEFSGIDKAIIEGYNLEARSSDKKNIIITLKDPKTNEIKLSIETPYLKEGLSWVSMNYANSPSLPLTTDNRGEEFLEQRILNGEVLLVKKDHTEPIYTILNQRGIAGNTFFEAYKMFCWDSDPDAGI